jgi:RsiW-degrading membrane proteinase PrsW (M82 family)
LNRVDSQYWRKPSASADEQYQDKPGVSSPAAVGNGQAQEGNDRTEIRPQPLQDPTVPVRPQGTTPGSERIEEPSYQEHGGSSSGETTVVAPSFYPADLPERQFQGGGAGTSGVAAGGREAPYRSKPYPPQEQTAPSATNPPYEYRGAPMPYTNPQVYQQPGYAQQTQPSTNPQGYQQPGYAQQPRPYINPQGYQQPANEYAQQPRPNANPQAYQQPPNGYAQQPQPPYGGYPYQGYYYAPNGYQQGGYPPPGYSPPGYPGYPYAWYPPRPRRNGYQLGMAITSLVGSILAILGGIVCGIILLALVLAPAATSTGEPAQYFESLILMASLMLAGVVGGGFGIFHSAFALAGQTSRPVKFPPFWSFLTTYIALMIVGLMVGTSDAIVNNWPLVFALIVLSGTLPALTFFSFALRRVRRPNTREWPTTWRRFTLALVSGATSAIFLALVFEGILTLIAGSQFIDKNTSFIDNPSTPTPHDPGTVFFLLILLSVIAPIVEEGFKPLAVITMIGRIRSASEAFILGMACGIGFDVIETTAYIAQGYQDWINIAIERSTAGLLHGLGAGMMALGWYYITHKDALKRYHLQIGLGCMLYAILQHAIWNGSFVLMLLPDPIGPYLENGKIPLFTYQLDAFFIVYTALSIAIFCFLWFVTGKIRHQPDAPLRNNGKADQKAAAKVAPTS